MSGSEPTPERASHPAPSELPYDASEAATGYAGVTGLVSTFALAAVVLVFLLAATAMPKPSFAQRADMSFATILFAVGFLGCLLAAFEFASLAGGPKNIALTNSMLIASIVGVCLIAVLGGFEALARGFLPTTAPVFTLVTVVAAGLSPMFIWFPMFSYERSAQSDAQPPATWAHHRYKGPATWVVESRPLKSWLEESETLEPERKMIALVLEMTVVGALAALTGWLLHTNKVFGQPEENLYYWIGIFALGFIALMTATALLLAADPRRKLRPNKARFLNLAQVLLMALIIASLP